MNQNEFNELIRRIDSKKELNGNRIVVDALNISYGTSEFKHIFTVHGSGLHKIRSLSKLVVSLCIGIAIDSGKYFVDNDQLSLNTRIWSTFREKVNLVNTTNTIYLEKITIKNSLTQTTGYSNDELLFSTSLKNENIYKLIDVVFNEPINIEPGKLFVYSNASAFILSAFFQELTGENLYQFAQRVLFMPLNIFNHSWINYGNYCAGATGLYLMSEDVHKLGKLMLNKGVWNNTQIVSEEFVDEMIKNHVGINYKKEQKYALSPSAYGFFIWIYNNGYYISGAKGQYIIVKPYKKMVISILSNQEDTIPLLDCLKDIL